MMRAVDPWGLDADDADEWATTLVTSSAWIHLSWSPVCLGWALTHNGRVTCGRCNWRISGRLDDVGTTRSARFALLALAQIGQAFGWGLIDALTSPDQRVIRPPCATPKPLI